MTGNPLIGVSVSTGKSFTTFSNSEGNVALNLPSREMEMCFSAIGYATLRKRASQVSQETMMAPLDLKQKETSEHERDFIHASIVENLDEEYQYSKNKKATFLVRSVVEKDGRCVIAERLERFICSSNLREEQFLEGYVYGDTEDIQLTNLLNDTLIKSFIEIAPRVYDNGFWASKLLPLGARTSVLVPSNYVRKNPGIGQIECFRGWKQNYILEFLHADDASDNIGVVNFMPREGKHAANVLTGTMYYGIQKYQLLGFKGCVSNVEWNVPDEGRVVISPEISIIYSHQRGFTEVIYVSARIDIGNLHILIQAYNLGKKRPLDWQKCVPRTAKEEGAVLRERVEDQPTLRECE